MFNISFDLFGTGVIKFLVNLCIWTMQRPRFAKKAALTTKSRGSVVGTLLNHLLYPRGGVVRTSVATDDKRSAPV